MKKNKLNQSRVTGKIWLYADIFLKARKLIYVSMRLDHLSANGSCEEIKRRVKHHEAMESVELRELAVVYLAFSIEAYLNQAGEMEFEDWKEIWERASWQKKLNIICKKIGLEIDKSQDVYRRTKLLFKNRDLIAHGRVLTASGKTSGDPKKYFESQTKFHILNPNEAHEFLISTEKLIQLIHSKRSRPEDLNRIFTIDVSLPQFEN
jgi:hypothetical protein